MTAPSAAPSATDESERSLKRVMRYGFSLQHMQALPVDVRHFQFGVPYDEFAYRDDRMNLVPGGFLSAGTILRVQRDFTHFREMAGARFLRPEAVPGVMIAPVESLPVEVGVGGVISLDEYAANSVLASRAFFGTLQLGVVF